MTRQDRIDQLKSTEFDVLIIGGGITGVGVALDAASRGLSVACIEMQDFAGGTSSKSTKLIHGGLRYLKQFDFALVHEVGTEREVVHKNAFHLVHPEKMLLPIYKQSEYSKFFTKVGLSIYDWLANVDPADRHRMLSAEETIAHEPLLKKTDLLGAGYYAEYRTDDARLVIAVGRTAEQYKAVLLNHCKAVSFDFAKQRLNAVNCLDLMGAEEFTIKAKTIVNAAGPWVDQLRLLDMTDEGKKLHLTKGVHIVVDHKRFPVKQSVYFDIPDGRMMFAIPREGKTYIGTTDTDFRADPVKPYANLDDVSYIVNSLSQVFPDTRLQVKDIESSWAGLRPLIQESGKSASEISRKDELFVSKSGLISIAGGKLTGYRKMAEKTVNQVMKQLGKKASSKTKSLKLYGNRFNKYSEVAAYCTQLADSFKRSLKETTYLVQRYGSDAESILESAKKIDGQMPLLMAELDYCIDHEWIERATDFIDRRSGRLYFQFKELEKISGLILLRMRERKSWSDERYQDEKNHLNTIIRKVSVFS
ncbi:MAG: glycerol-3-phosphate dehydrogenase/oxidase [Calditrichaeota bacterium]|nr:glycerol-3-phosphate dehydrogenase/oxidase [Calditrichota bacterium]